MKLFTLFFFITLSLYASEPKMPLKKLERHRGNEEILKKLNRKQSKKEQDQLRKNQQFNKAIKKELESDTELTAQCTIHDQYAKHKQAEYRAKQLRKLHEQEREKAFHANRKYHREKYQRVKQAYDDYIAEGLRAIRLPKDRTIFAARALALEFYKDYPEYYDVLFPKR